VHYRDARTEGVADRVLAAVTADEMYAITGIQQLPFNTIYQLAATPGLGHAATMLLIPDLLGYWLTGQIGAEVTNASTTSLFDVRAQDWAAGLIRKAGIPRRIFPPLRRPGEVIGPILEPNGLGPQLPLITVCSHDTASAVAGVPAEGPGFAYISSGTWSLAGVELDTPVLTEASRAANFTNETGIDGTIRYLRNLTGLWLLQVSLRTWPGASLESLLREASRVPRLRFVIDPDDPVFVPPGDMPTRIASWLAGRGEAVPAGPAETVRCILDSLALAYRRAIAEVQSLSGRHADVAHRGRRGQERAAIPAHGRRHRAPGDRRAGRGHRAGQRARPSPGARRGPRRPGRDARADPVHPAAALVLPRGRPCGLSGSCYPDLIAGVPRTRVTLSTPSRPISCTICAFSPLRSRPEGMNVALCTFFCARCHIHAQGDQSATGWPASQAAPRWYSRSTSGPRRPGMSGLTG
jgi:hypothetical protein